MFQQCVKNNLMVHIYLCLWGDLSYVEIFGPLIPLFWTSGDVSSGFQSHRGQPHSCLAYVPYVLYVLWDSPLVWHLLTSWWQAWQPSHSQPHTYEQAIGGEGTSKPESIMPPLTVWHQAGRYSDWPMPTRHIWILIFFNFLEMGKLKYPHSLDLSNNRNDYVP